ncbi:MAG: hypothetical protein ACQSGP_11510 [Frankia sp.]
MCEELAKRVRRVQLVQVINDQRQVDAIFGEFRQHPVDHGPRIEGGGRCRRFRVAARAGGLTDRVKQGQPETLGVLLVAPHLHDGGPT